jgi:DNA-3-methyladenine glycosylase
VPAGQLVPLSRRFFARSSPLVAPDLLGRLLIRHLGEETLVARIVETEAYEEGDPASHSYRGRTARTEVMFGEPGHLYVYFTYGMHYCMNVVTGRDGEGSAVLLRAAEPILGLDAMRRRRGVEDPERLLAGPARLTQALDVERALNGADLVAGRELVVARGRPIESGREVVGRRVGIRVGLDRPWRFAVRDSRFVSSPRP